MQRIKIPYGALTPEQLELLADLAEEYSDGICHVTTRQDIQLRADQPQIVALPRPEHHAMFAELHGLRVSIDRDVPYSQKEHVVPAGC